MTIEEQNTMRAIQSFCHAAVSKETRRYEIAKDVLASLTSRDVVNFTPEELAQKAVKYADALLKELHY